MAGVRSGAGKRRLAFQWAVVVAAGVSLSLLVARAEAYDSGDCQRSFPAGTVLRDVDTLRIDTGNFFEVDFGDDLHLGGAPQGTAVVCWQRGRKRVAVIGKLYVDPRVNRIHACVEVEVEFLRRDGSGAGGDNDSVCTLDPPVFHTGTLNSVEVRYLVTDHDLNKVRVKLFGTTGELATTVTRKYGD